MTLWRAMTLNVLTYKFYAALSAFDYRIRLPTYQYTIHPIVK